MRNWRWSRIGFLVLAVILILALSLIGCTKTTPEENTLKVGLVCFFGWPIGVSMIDGIEIMIDKINQDGGLTVGGKTYKVEFIYYDSNANQSTAVAAASRLIHEDNVKFIMADMLSYEEAWLQETEPNKVIVSGCTTSPNPLSPKYHYVFNTAPINNDGPATISFLLKTYPDKNSVLIASPDNQDAHNFVASLTATLDTFGFSHTEFFYPPTLTDLSVVGTKAKTVNPDYFMATAGGPTLDQLAMKATRDAGYKGMLVGTGAQDLVNLFSILTPADMEGFINPALPVEFDPALTPLGVDFKAAYIAKKGEWDGPSLMQTNCWSGLYAAIVKADSIDTDAVANTLSSGLQYEGLAGQCEMIARPDLGNSRTVDSGRAVYFKECVGGKPKLIGQISLDEMSDIFLKVFPPK